MCFAYVSKVEACDVSRASTGDIVVGVYRLAVIPLTDSLNKAGDNTGVLQGKVTQCLEGTVAVPGLASSHRRSRREGVQRVVPEAEVAQPPQS